jgi:short-subunit dehydrogenase
VIIIGGTSGIGRELAKVFARRGYMVAASGRRNDLLISLQGKFKKNIVIECFDVTGKENIVHLRNMIEKLAGVDIIIYSSGYGEVSEQLEWDIEKQTTEVNVNGFVEIISYAFKYFINQGFGHIACISSIGSIKGNAYAPAYSASKAYQSNYMEGLYFKAKKLKANIAVTDIQAGFVDTALAKGDKRFWVATPQKAAQQIYAAIVNKKKIAYVTKRWWLIAALFKYLPDFIYRKIGRQL